MMVYLISYYRRDLCVREYYLNRSSFVHNETAEREVDLIKKHEKDLFRKYKIPVNRIRFKIESITIKK
jgi:hypothetical protein